MYQVRMLASYDSYRRQLSINLLHSVKLLLLPLMVISLTLCAANDAVGQKSRMTTLAVQYGYGGIWYLNAIDPVHALKVHVSHGQRSGNASFSLKTGYERLEETSILPILVQVERYFGKHSAALDLGYGFAINDDLEDQSGIEVDGGTAASVRYQYHLGKTDLPQIVFSLGYSYRFTEIENTVNQVSAEQHYHHIETGVGFRF